MAHNCAIGLSGYRRVIFAVASPLIVLIIIAAAIVVELLRRRGRSVDLGRGVGAMVMIFFVTSVALAAPRLDFADPPSPAPGDGDAIYIVLLDGYPREETLASLGIEIRPFISRLEDRGFEYYPQAASRHDATALALTAM